MKPLSILVLSALFGCTAEREIQATMVDATLVKIETIKRYNEQKKILTWKTSKDVMYITVEPEYTNLTVGTQRKVLIHR